MQLYWPTFRMPEKLHRANYHVLHLVAVVEMKFGGVRACGVTGGVPQTLQYLVALSH